MRKFFRKVGRVAKRAYRSKVGKAIRKVTRQRYGTWSRPNVGAIASDVARLKSLINVEKKRAQWYFIANQGLGQLDVNSGGYLIQDMTPTSQIAQGTGSGARTGDSVKLTGCQIRGQFFHQANTVNDIRVVVEVFRCKNQIPTTISGTIMSQVYLTDPISGLIDYNSCRDPNYFNQYTRIISRKFVVKGDSISGQTGVKDFTLNLKMNHHLRWAKDSTTLSNGQFFVTIRADNGNRSSTVSTIGTPVATLGASTGLLTNMMAHYYYVDN